jgi:hypothetical protein
LESRSLRRLALALVAILLIAGLAKAEECGDAPRPADAAHHMQLAPAEPGEGWSDAGFEAGAVHGTLPAAVIDVSAAVPAPPSRRRHGLDNTRFTIQRK